MGRRREKMDDIFGSLTKRPLAVFRTEASLDNGTPALNY
jgi:uncharacterized protein (DUF885 family)